MKKIKILSYVLLAIVSIVAGLGIFSGAFSFEAAGVIMSATPLIWMVDKKFKELSLDEINGLTDAEKSEYHLALTTFKEGEKTRLEAEIKTLQTKEGENSEKIKELEESIKGVNIDILNTMAKSIKEIGLEMTKIKTEGLGRRETKTIAKLLETKKTEIENVRDKAVKIMINVNDYSFKATQAPTDIGDREELGQWIQGVEQLARRAPFVRDWFRTVFTTKEYVKKMEQDVVVRDAKNVAACGETTHTTKLTWKKTDLQIRKVRDFVDICLDMLDDYDFVEGEIRDLINYGVMIKVDSQLLLGTGVSPQIAGIESYASTFSAALAGADYSAATGTTIQSPNLGDLICVAGAQIEYLGKNSKFTPNVAFVNPKQITNLKLTKDKKDQYLLPNWISPNGEKFGGIILVGNPLVPENEAYVMDSTKGVIYERKEIAVEMSYENATNFETETVTVKGYERLNLWVSDANSNAFMHLANISGALTAITK